MFSLRSYLVSIMRNDPILTRRLGVVGFMMLFAICGAAVYRTQKLSVQRATVENEAKSNYPEAFAKRVEPTVARHATITIVNASPQLVTDLRVIPDWVDSEELAGGASIKPGKEKAISTNLSRIKNLKLSYRLSDGFAQTIQYGPSQLTQTITIGRDGRATIEESE